MAPPARGGMRSALKQRDPMTSWKTCPAIERDPDKVSGAWVFSGTRVPIAALFENLRAGATVEQFLDWFPGVERWQAESVLDHESGACRCRRLEDPARPGRAGAPT